MPSTYVSEKFETLDADGTTDGLADIGNNTGWIPGAKGWLAATGETSLNVMVIEQVAGDTVRLREIGATAQGPTDISAYTTAKSASLALEGQIVPVLAPYEPRSNA